MMSISSSKGKSEYVIGCFDKLHVLCFNLNHIMASSLKLLLKSRCFFVTCNWVQVSYKDLFFLFILVQALYTRLSLRLLFCFSQSLCVFISLSLWTNCVNNLIWAASQKQQKIEAKCFIATILSFVITGPCVFNRPFFAIQISFKKKKEKRHKINNFISCWQRVLEKWMIFLMERLHAVFYQAFSCQCCWLIVAFGLVTIELNEPGNGCFTD